MARTQPVKLEPATVADAVALAALHTSVAGYLTSVHGTGPWASRTTEKGVLFAMRHSQVLVARRDGEIVATLRLATKKPWAIDTDYFTTCRKPMYLLAMAVAPAWQRRGLGRQCLAEAVRIAQAGTADAIRLDAYDAKAGAGAFYARCGFKKRGRVVYRGAALVYFEMLLGKD
jgi:ribosomal protein S18 acetylase RimI-like enzyme